MSTSAPPELPGLIGALVWITFGSVTPPPSDSVRLSALMIPSVTLEARPRGLPIAITMSPTSSFDELANVAGRSLPPFTLMTARSSCGNAPTSFAVSFLPADVVTVKLVKPLTTWLLVTTWPFESKTMPEPSPAGVRIWTTDGDTCRKTVTYAFCRLATPGGTLSAGAEERAREVGVEGPEELARVVVKPTSAPTTSDAARTTSAARKRVMHTAVVPDLSLEIPKKFRPAPT